MLNDQYEPFYNDNCIVIWIYSAISDLTVVVLISGYDLGFQSTSFSSIRSKIVSVGRKFYFVTMLPPTVHYIVVWMYSAISGQVVSLLLSGYGMRIPQWGLSSSRLKAGEWC